MLKRKEKVGKFREPAKMEYANVIPLVDARYASQEESARALGSIEEKLVGRVQRAVERFLSSPDIDDLGKFNDLILRTYLKLPARVRETQQGTAFFEKIRRIANEEVAKRRNSIDRRNENPEVVRFLDSSAEEMGENLLTLESSVMQLARFVSSQAQSHPDRVFATGVNLDVRYGIDLIGADVTFDPVKRQLVVDLILWQAKASRVGMSADDVRAISQRYARQQQAVEEDLEFDASWVQEHLLKRRPEPNLELDDDTALNIVTGEIRQLVQLHQNLEQLSPQDRFLAELKTYRLLEAFAKELDVEMPEGVIQPRIVIGDVGFRYLLDTKRGTRDLTQDDAASFGLAA